MFSKKILLLQNSALQQLKSMLLTNFTNAMYEAETREAVERVKPWLDSNAEQRLVPSMFLPFRSAHNDAQNALHMHGEGITKSPTAEFQSMLQMERHAQRVPVR